MMLAFTFAVILAFAAVILAVAFILPALTFAETFAFPVTLSNPTTLAAEATFNVLATKLFDVIVFDEVIFPVKLATFPLSSELTFTFGAVNVPESVMLAMPVTLCGRLTKIGTVP